MSAALHVLRQAQLGRYQLEPFRVLTDADRQELEIVPIREARSVIEHAFASAIARPALIRLWRSELGLAGQDANRDALPARTWLLDAIERTHPTWWLLRRRLPAINGHLEFAAPPPPPAPPEVVAPPSWLELEVLYTDDTGAIGLPYRVDIPGDVRTGRLDRFGYAYLTGIKPGSYKTFFGQALDPPPEELTGWIDLELVDAWGIPIAGAAYVVTLPDQQERRGVLDQNGRAHLAGLPEGDCKVIFPELDTSFVASSEE